MKHGILIVDENSGGPAQLDSIFHFLSGSLAVNAYAAFCSAGRSS